MEQIKVKVGFIFKVIEEVDMPIVDLSKLTRVSRPALHRWKKGQPIADMLRLDMVYTLCLRLDKARQEGVLPLKDKYKQKERLKVLRNIIANTRLA